MDVEKLVDLLMRYCLGFRRAFRVVRVPSEGVEAAQRLHREDEYLLRQRTRIVNRMKGLLIGQGVAGFSLRGDFLAWLEGVRLWNGQELSAPLKSELSRLYAQYALIREQLGAMSGLTPTPSHSGDVETEQVISKAGNRRVRRVMIELAWMWLRWQPLSALS